MNETPRSAPCGIFYERCRNKKWNIRWNDFLNRDIILLAVITVLCAVGFLFSVEAVIYGIYMAAMAAVVLFGRSIGKAMLFVPFFYIMPSIKNNPNVNSGSIFYSVPVLVCLCALVAIYLALTAAAMIKDRKSLRRGKPAFLWGFVALGAAYLLSGAFTEYYSLANFLFAFGEIAALCLFYFIALYTVDWSEMKKDTFAWIGFFMGMLLLVELVAVYANNDIFAHGHLTRGNLYTGWGIHNNLGNFMCVTIPCMFYLVNTRKQKIAFFAAACIEYCGVCFTTSRGSAIFGGIVFLICFIITMRNLKGTKLGRAFVAILAAVILCLVAAVAIMLATSDVIQATLEKVLEAGFLDDSGRISSWKDGIEQFLNYPIFGAGFYECTAYRFGGVSNILPARWHNSIVQLLASCGVVGLAAYIFHRVQTVVFACKNRSRETLFIALSILPILLGSLVDNHLFNFGPGLFYGLFLAFAEGLAKYGNKPAEEEQTAEAAEE